MLLALHGVPTSPVIFARLATPLHAPQLSGTLAQQVDDVEPLVDRDTILLGHDMGGVVAAMVALRRRPRMVILTGTALGPYWSLVRATAWPGFWRYFYARHGGAKFVAGAVAPSRASEAVAAFPGADPGEMRRIARSMRPPPGLARKLAALTQVRLVWGRQDRWYPPVIARALARATSCSITWVDGGHFSMWESPGAFDAALASAVGVHADQETTH